MFLIHEHFITILSSSLNLKLFKIKRWIKKAFWHFSGNYFDKIKWQPKLVCRFILSKSNQCHPVPSFMANRWGNCGNSDRLYFGGLQNHCRWWLWPWNLKMLTPWKESYDQLSILKSRDITLLTGVCLVKAMVFPVVMYGCESWTVKKAERWRIDALQLWC